MTRIIRIAAPLAVLAAAALAFAVTRSTSPDRQLEEDTTINLVAFSTPKAAYGELIKAFDKTAPGKDVTFTQSYGASGDQARAVAAGQPADVVALSLAPDVDTLVKAGVVAAKWNKNKYERHGRALGRRPCSCARATRSTSRLGRPHTQGIQVITPNPFTSGGARWNVMAAYGAKPRRARPTSRRSST